jgi:stearoyl-CoA desaturase (delta-9 desaturase)
MKYRLPFTKETTYTRHGWFQYAMVLSLPFSFYFLTLEQWVYSLLVGYVLAIIGQIVGHHRYFSHRSFKLNIFWHYVLCYLTTVLSIGSVLEWRRMHLAHHKYSDTQYDPHSPTYKGILKVFFISWFDYPQGVAISEESEKLKSEKGIVFFHTYYVYIILFHIAIVSLIDPKLLYALYFFPPFLALSMGSLVNSLLHNENGPKDNILLAFIAGGDGYHAIHHEKPYLATYPFPDLAGMIISLIKKKE